MGVKIRTKRNRLYLDIIHGGKHHWESLHIELSDNVKQRAEQLRIAEICRAKRELQLVAGEWNLEDQLAGKQSLIDYMKKKSKRMSPKSPYVRVIHYLQTFSLGQTKLTAINESWVIAFQNYLLENDNLTALTAYNYSIAIRTALNMAVKERIISRSPALAVKGLKKPIIDKPTLTADEFKLLKRCNLDTEYERDVQRAFIFACYTGLRVSDMKSLKFKNIEKKLLTKSNRNKFWVHKIQNKTKDLVEIPISLTALDLIQPFGAPEEFVFPKLATITTDANRVIKKMAAICKIEKNISFHTARRSCATFMLEAGVDPFTVQKILGHRKIEMTAIYAKTDRTKSKAIEALDEFFEQNDLQNQFNVV